MDKEEQELLIAACAPPEAFTEQWFDMLAGYLSNHSYLASHADMIVRATRKVVESHQPAA